MTDRGKGSFRSQTRVDVEPGNVTIAIALTSLSALVVGGSQNHWLRLTAAMAYIFCGWGGSMLYWGLLEKKLPTFHRLFTIRGGHRNARAAFLIFSYWFTLMRKFFLSPTELKPNEIEASGFLSVLVGINMLWIVGLFFIWERVFHNWNM